MKNAGRKAWVLVVVLLAGAIIGNSLWMLLLNVLPASMNVSLQIGSTAAPWVLDLHVFALALGLKLNLNPGSAIGMLTGLLFYFWRR